MSQLVLLDENKDSVEPAIEPNNNNDENQAMRSNNKFKNMLRKEIKNKFMQLFEKTETPIECKQCLTEHYDIYKNKYCYNCGHCLSLQTIERDTYKNHKADKRKYKKLKKKLLSFTTKRFNLVTEYQNKCKIMDTIIIQLIEEKIKIEQDYIENNKLLINKFNENNTKNTDFTSTVQQIISTYIETMDATITVHSNYLLFLGEILKYLQTENETMLDFLSAFKRKHDNKLNDIWLAWKNNEYLLDSDKITNQQYENTKKKIWNEWKIFLKQSLKSFPKFIKTRHKKIVEKVLKQIIMNEMEKNNKIHCKYLNIWNIINDIINENTEIEIFMEYHKNISYDTLESLINSLGFSTRNTIPNENTNAATIEDIESEIDNNNDNILSQTRCNGIEWFSPLIFSEKGKKTWNLNKYEWNLVIFEQILREVFVINDKQWDEKLDKAISCIRFQFEISTKKMNELIAILTIENENENKYKLNSLCHRLFVINNLKLETHFNGLVSEYNNYIHRQLSFILSCIIWYILESNRKFWDVSGTKLNNTDLMQSLHDTCNLVQDFCKQKVDENNENSEKQSLFSPINHLMLMIQEIACGLNIESDVSVPNAIYHKIYIEIINNCLIEKEFDELGLDLDLSSSDSKKSRLSFPLLPELNDNWTQIADLLFVLSTKTFKISVKFHCFAFLELIFDQIIDKSESDINPLLLFQPNNNKKDKILLKIIEETFRILLDDINDDKREKINKYQEDIYINKVRDKIENKLSLWLSDYKDCNAYTISKCFIFFIFIKKIKHKNIDFMCDNKLLDFTLITTTQMCNVSDDEQLQTKFENMNNFQTFCDDFLRILHDEIRWHSNLDKYLKENISNFNNNHTETFLLQWISKFSHLINDKLKHLKHQDIDTNFLSLIDEINKVILICNQYKNRVSIENKTAWYDALPPLNRICVFKFKQWIKIEIEPIFVRCIDNVIQNETWNAYGRKSLEITAERKSSLFLQHTSTMMSAALNEVLSAPSRASSNVDLTNIKYVSDYMIDLCTLADSMTNGCLSFLVSLKLYNFNDSKSYWKVLQKQLGRLCTWMTNNINKQISNLLPITPVLSLNIRPCKKDENKSDTAAVQMEDENEQNKALDIEQESKLKKLAIQMHSLDFILSSLNHTKMLIQQQYHTFIHNEFKQDADEYLQRQVVIMLEGCNVYKFLLDNFIFIPLKYDKKIGCVVSNINEKSIEAKYEISIGFELIKIEDINCTNMYFNDIMDLIENDYNRIFDDKIKLEFKFNTDGVINTLFFDIYEKYNASLQSIASLISCEIIYNNLYDDLFNKLYKIPLHENRFSDLNISNKLYRICDPIFEFLNDKNFGLIIKQIFENLMHCICFILTQKTQNIKTKAWIKNDYMLMRDDIDYIIKSFADDIDTKYIEHKCSRIYNILEMIKLSTTHLTQHTLPSLHDYNASCVNNHILYECLLHPNKLLDYKRDNNVHKDKKKLLIKCIRCRIYINIKYNLNEIGYYFCGHEICLKNNIFYCGNCCNKLMYQQNIKYKISKFDVISILNKKKNENNSTQFANKYVQNQCIRSQIKMTFEEKEWKHLNKKQRKIQIRKKQSRDEDEIDKIDLP